MTELAEKQAQFEAEHHAQGWFINVYADEPGEVSPAHRHGEAHLLILEGSADLTLDDLDKRSLKPGDSVEVADGQLHAVVAGPKGFRYAFACPMDEAIKLELVD